MSTVPDQPNRCKRRVEALHERDGFRRVRADIVWSFFINRPTAYLDDIWFSVQVSGSNVRIRPGWRLRGDWDQFRREQLSSLSDRHIECALQDLEALGHVNITREGAQIVVHRVEAVARECVA